MPTVHAKSLEELNAKIDAALRRAFDKAMKACEVSMHLDAEIFTPQFKGNLLRSIVVDSTPNGFEFKFTAPYAADLLTGIKPKVFKSRKDDPELNAWMEEKYDDIHEGPKAGGIKVMNPPEADINAEKRPDYPEGYITSMTKKAVPEFCSIFVTAIEQELGSLT